jgi:hypothetical protein
MYGRRARSPQDSVSTGEKVDREKKKTAETQSSHNGEWSEGHAIEKEIPARGEEGK